MSDLKTIAVDTVMSGLNQAVHSSLYSEFAPSVRPLIYNALIECFEMGVDSVTKPADPLTEFYPKLIPLFERLLEQRDRESVRPTPEDEEREALADYRFEIRRIACLLMEQNPFSPEWSFEAYTENLIAQAKIFHQKLAAVH